MQDVAVERGPHPSAAFQYSAFLLEDFYDYVLMGYWLVLPYRSIRGHPALKLAPAGIVPQHECCPRPIMDYTFNHVNQDSVPCAPYAAMQFGPALQQLPNGWPMQIQHMDRH
jgi:hypothetical protein